MTWLWILTLLFYLWSLFSLWSCDSECWVIYIYGSSVIKSKLIVHKLCLCPSTYIHPICLPCSEHQPGFDTHWRTHLAFGMFGDWGQTKCNTGNLYVTTCMKIMHMWHQADETPTIETPTVTTKIRYWLWWVGFVEGYTTQLLVVSQSLQ